MDGLDDESHLTQKGAFQNEYQSLLLEKLRLEINEKKNPKKEPAPPVNIWKDIFPAALQLTTIIITVLILWWTDVFDAHEKLQLAKSIQLKMDNDKLDARKDSLSHDNDSLRIEIKEKGNILKSQTKEIGDSKMYQKTLRNTIATIQVISENNRNEAAVTLRRQISSHLSDYEHNKISIDDPAVDFLKRIAKKGGDNSKFLRIELGKYLATTHKDSIKIYANRIKFSALGYFIFGSQDYYLTCKLTMPKFILLTKNSGTYPPIFLQFLLSNRWSQADKEDNLNTLVNYGLIYTNLGIMADVVSVNMSRIFYENRESQKSKRIRILNDYLYTQIGFFPAQTTKMYYSQALKESYTSLLHSYFLECPQCFIALEAEIYKIYPDSYKNLQSDSGTITITLNWNILKQPSGFATATNVTDIFFAKIGCLPFQQIYSDPELKEIYTAFKKRLSFPDFGIADFASQFAKFYEKYHGRIRFWLPQNIMSKLNTKQVVKMIRDKVF